MSTALYALAAFVTAGAVVGLPVAVLFFLFAVKHRTPHLTVAQDREASARTAWIVSIPCGLVAGLLAAGLVCSL